MAMSRQQMLKELKSIEAPKLFYDEDFQADSTLRVISNEGGYCLEPDAFPIDGPFEVSEDEFNSISKITEDGEDPEGFLDLSDEQFEMVEAGCEPELAYYRYQMNVRDDRPVFSEDREELEAVLIDDVMDFADCRLWDEMSTAELLEWYTWHTHADT